MLNFFFNLTKKTEKFSKYHKDLLSEFRQLLAEERVCEKNNKIQVMEKRSTILDGKSDSFEKNERVNLLNT